MASDPASGSGQVRPGGDRVRRKPVGWWALCTGMVLVFFALAWVKRLRPVAAAVVVVLVIGLVEVSVWRRGYDSRDGLDWKRSLPNMPPPRRRS